VLAADAGAIYTREAVNKDTTKRAAEGVVESGEVVEFATQALVGSLQLGRQVAIGVATAIATAGLLSVAVSKKPEPVVLTTRRLLVLGMKNTFIDQADSKIRLEFPRSALRGRAHRVFTYYVLDLADADGRPIGRLRFPFWSRADAKAIADALGPPPPVMQKSSA
jgi:uncharacterized membrane protein (UPF0136 family)